MTEEIDGHVERSGAGHERLGGVDDVGVEFPSDVVLVAEVGAGQVARVLAQILGEGTVQVQLLDQAASVLVSGGLARFQVVHVADDEATNCHSSNIQISSRPTLSVSSVEYLGCIPRRPRYLGRATTRRTMGSA